MSGLVTQQNQITSPVSSPSTSSSLSSIIKKIQMARLKLKQNQLQKPITSTTVTTISTTKSPLAQKLASDLTTNELLDLLRSRVNVTITTPKKEVITTESPLNSISDLEQLSEEELQALVASDPELKNLLLGVSPDYISPDLVNLSKQNDPPSQSLLLIRQQQLNDKMDLMQQQLNLKNSLEEKLKTKQTDHILLSTLLTDYQNRLEVLTNNYKMKLENLQNQSNQLKPQIQQDPRLSQLLGILKYIF
jgi:hypothetical protein